VHPFLLTSLDRFKNRVGKGAADTTNDDQILSIIAEASGIADRFTGRNLRIRTYGGDDLDFEYADGNGSDTHQTKQWPIYSVTTVHDDTSRVWGSDFLKPAADYLIHRDKGELQLFPLATKGTIWKESTSNIKLAYTAGYGIFQIIDGVNDKIDFEETTSTELTATVAEGLYNVTDLLTALDTALDAAGASTHTCTYDYWESKFSLVSDRSGGTPIFKLLTTGGTNVGTSIWRTIGFSTLADVADADPAVHQADNSALGIPADLEEAVLEIALRIYQMTPGFGGARFDIVTQSQSGSHGQVYRYDENRLPRNALATLKRFKRLEV